MVVVVELVLPHGGEVLRGYYMVSTCRLFGNWVTKTVFLSFGRDVAVLSALGFGL